MLIDDDEWIRDSLSLFFQAEGCRLLTVESAEEGLAALKKQNYDIIITDYRLPGMDGLVFLGLVQNLCPNALNILITAYRNPVVVSKANKMGVDDFIEKPFTSKTIEESLSRLIATSKKEERCHDPKN